METDTFWIVPRIHQDKRNKVYYLFREDGTQVTVFILIDGNMPTIINQTHILKEEEKKTILEVTHQRHLK